MKFALDPSGRANADPAGHSRPLVVSRALVRFPLAVSCPSLTSSWLIAPSRTVSATVVSWTARSHSTRPRPSPLSNRIQTRPRMAHARPASQPPSLQVVSPHCPQAGLMSTLRQLSELQKWQHHQWLRNQPSPRCPLSKGYLHLCQRVRHHIAAFVPSCVWFRPGLSTGHSYDTFCHFISDERFFECCVLLTTFCGFCRFIPAAGLILHGAQNNSCVTSSTCK